MLKILLVILLVFATVSEAGENRNKQFNKADQNRDGFLSRTEMQDAHNRRFEKMFQTLDQDGDNQISDQELRKGRNKMRQRFENRRIKNRQ